MWTSVWGVCKQVCNPLWFPLSSSVFSFFYSIFVKFSLWRRGWRRGLSFCFYHFFCPLGFISILIVLQQAFYRSPAGFCDTRINRISTWTIFRLSPHANLGYSAVWQVSALKYFTKGKSVHLLMIYCKKFKGKLFFDHECNGPVLNCLIESYTYKAAPDEDVSKGKNVAVKLVKAYTS